MDATNECKTRDTIQGPKLVDQLRRFNGLRKLYDILRNNVAEELNNQSPLTRLEEEMERFDQLRKNYELARDNPFQFEINRFDELVKAYNNARAGYCFNN